MKVKNLEQALDALKRIENNSRQYNLYVSDSTGFDWYFSPSGYAKNGLYFDFYIHKRNGKVVVEESSTTKVTFKEMTKNI